MHRDIILRYIELQALLLTPITPHWSEYVWLEVLKKVCFPENFHLSKGIHILRLLIIFLIEQPDTIQNALFPNVPEPSPALSSALIYVRTTSSNITSSEATFARKLSKGKTVSFDPRKPKKLTIFAAKKFPSWQEKYIDLVREAFDEVSLSINDKELNGKVSKLGEMKKAMPFVQGLKKRLVTAKELPETVFNRKLGFDELSVLGDMVAGLIRTTGCKVVEVVAVEEGGKAGTTLDGQPREGLPNVAENAVPGQPTFHFENIPEAGEV